MARKPEDTQKLSVEFNVVLSAADDSRFEESIPQFAKAFGIEDGTAAQIVKGAPILFLPKVSKTDIRSIKERLLNLSKLGLEFRVTTKPAAQLPRVIWAHPPQFAAMASGEVLECANLDWGKMAFVCPGCGEVFVMRHVGKALGRTPAPAPAAREAKHEDEGAEGKHKSGAGKSGPKQALSKRGAPAEELLPADDVEPLEAPVPLESLERLEKADAEELQPLDEIPEPVENLEPLATEPEQEEGVELLSPEPLEELSPAAEEAEEISLEEAAGEEEELVPADSAEDEEVAPLREEDEVPEIEELKPQDDEAAEELEEIEEEEEAEELEEVLEEEEEPAEEEEEEEEEEVAPPKKAPVPVKAPPPKGKPLGKEPVKEHAKEPPKKEPPKPEPVKAAPPAKSGGGGASTAKGVPAKKPEPKPEPRPAPRGGGGGGGDDEEVLFSVFLSRIPTPDKQAQAAKLIADIRKVPLGEAKELASRMVIPVLKDVSKGEADAALEKFKKIKVAGRMTKKK